jgi:hypothetical protein
MSAPVKKAAAPAPVPETAAVLADQAVELAALAASWANQRVMPMVQALRVLAAFSCSDANACNSRLALIRDIANETDILINEMAGCFESEQRDFEAKLTKLEGGAQ